MKKTPKYQKVAQELKQHILQNLSLNDRIPVEEDLEKQFGVSRITIRQAVALLISEGWLNRQQGRGTFVARDIGDADSDRAIKRITLITRFTASTGLQVPYFNHILEGVIKECETQKIDLNILLFDHREKDLIYRIKKSESDALIIMNEAHIPELENLNIPTVGLCHFSDKIHFDYINNDDEAGSLIGIKYLLDLGVKDIAILTDTSNPAGLQHRLEGVYNAELLYGISINRNRIISIPFSPNQNSVDYGFTCMQTFLKKNKKLPQAIFALSDQFAMGALSALQQNGIACPDDILLLGYENIELSKYTSPPLSTIAVNMDLIGKTGVRRIIQRKNNPGLPFSRMNLPNSLLIRETTEKKS